MTPPPSTPKSPRPSVPDANEALSQNEAHRRATKLEEIERRQHDFEGWVRGVFEGQVRQHKASETRMGDQDVVIVATARAVGVHSSQLPAALVERSLPPPATGEDAAQPPAKQAATLPNAIRNTTYLAALVALFEAIKAFNELVHFFKLGGH